MWVVKWVSPVFLGSVLHVGWNVSETAENPGQMHLLSTWTGFLGLEGRTLWETQHVSVVLFKHQNSLSWGPSSWNILPVIILGAASFQTPWTLHKEPLVKTLTSALLLTWKSQVLKKKKSVLCNCKYVHGQDIPSLLIQLSLKPFVKADVKSIPTRSLQLRSKQNLFLDLRPAGSKIPEGVGNGEFPAE